MHRHWQSLVTHSTLTRAQWAFDFFYSCPLSMLSSDWAAIKSLGPNLNGFRLESQVWSGLAWPEQPVAEAKARAKHRPGRSHAHYACATRCVFVVKWPLMACKVLATEAKPSTERNGTDKETQTAERNNSNIKCLNTSLRLRALSSVSSDNNYVMSDVKLG